MKYLITESQLFNTVSTYIDMKKLFMVETSRSYNFYTSRESFDNDEYPVINFDKEFSDCFISSDFATELSDIFSFHFEQSLSLICDWVEKTLGVQVETFMSDFGAD